jgi:hypothetical protein
LINELEILRVFYDFSRAGGVIMKASSFWVSVELVEALQLEEGHI